MEKWKKVKLCDISDIIMGQSPPSETYNQIGFGMKFLQGCADFGKSYPSTNSFCSSPNRIAPKYSILFSVRAPVGKINYADEKYCIGRGLASIVPKNIDIQYLFNLLLFDSKRYDRLSQGSTFSSINSKELKALKFEIPENKNEQVTVASILETVNSLINKIDYLISKHQRIKTGLMQDLLTKGIDENGNIRSEKTHKFKDSPVGRIPVEWDVKKIIDTTYLKARIGWQGLKASEFLTDGPYLITGTDFENGNIDWTTCHHVTEDRYLEAPYIHIKEGDLLITKDGTIGKTAIARNCPAQAVLNSGVFVMRSLKNVYLHQYMYYILNSKYFYDHLFKTKGGSTINHLYQREFEKFEYPRPSLEEQHKIVSIIESVENHIQNEKEQLDKLLRIKQGLMQDLLTGKVRVCPEVLVE